MGFFKMRSRASLFLDDGLYVAMILTLILLLSWAESAHQVDQTDSPGCTSKR